MAPPLLDPLVVRELKKLFLTSGKAIAVYTNDLGSLEYVPAWPTEQPAAVHPRHPDHRFAGFIDWTTGAVGGTAATAGQDKAPAGQDGLPRVPLWARAAATLWMLVKAMTVIWFGAAILLMMFFGAVIQVVAGHSGGGGWGRR